MYVNVSSSHNLVQDLSDMMKQGKTPKVFFALFETTNQINDLKEVLDILRLPISGVVLDESLVNLRLAEVRNTVTSISKTCGYPVVSLEDIGKQENVVIVVLNSLNCFQLLINFFENHQLNCFLFHYFDLKNSSFAKEKNVKKNKIVYCDTDGSLLLDSTTVADGQVSYLRKNEMSRDGFWFKGWYAYRTSDKKMYYAKEGTAEKAFYEEGKQPEKWTPNLFRDGEGIHRLSEEDDDVIILRAQWEKCLVNSPEHAADNKELLREKLLHKPIVLLGGGSVCKAFYQKYHNILNVKCVLTDRNDEQQFKLDDGTVIKVEPYSKNKISTDDYIIVCRPVYVFADDYYKNAAVVLMRDGFEHMNNYIRSSLAEAILDGKKLWIWLGYCQFETIISILEQIGDISREYVLDYMRPGLHTLKSSHKFQDCQDMLKICDLFVYVPLIFSKGKMDFDYKEFLPKDAKTVCVPGVAFRGYYPYKDVDIATIHKYTYDRDIHYPFRYAENFLDELILKGLSDDEIYEEVMREDFIDEETIQKNLKLAYKSIEVSESASDIKILDFIKETLTDRMLYRDGHHYHNDMFFEFARRVCKYCNMDVIDEINSIEQNAKENGVQYSDVTETPVLPCVAKALGLDFVTDDKLWRVRFTEGGKNVGAKYFEMRLLTRKEWIYAYLAYTRAQMTLRDFWSFKE